MAEDRLQGINLSEADILGAFKNLLSGGNETKTIEVKTKGFKEGAKEATQLAQALDKLSQSTKGNELIANLKQITDLVGGKFKNVNLNAFTNKLMQAFSDPTKSAEELSSIVNEVFEDINALRRISGSDKLSFLSPNRINKLIEQQKKIDQLSSQRNEEVDRYKTEAITMARAVDIRGVASEKGISRRSHMDVAAELGINASDIRLMDDDDTLLSSYKQTAEVLLQMQKDRKKFGKITPDNVKDYLEQEQGLLSVFKQLQSLESQVVGRFNIDPGKLLSNEFKRNDGRFDFERNAENAVKAYAEQMTSKLTKEVQNEQNQLNQKISQYSQTAQKNVGKKAGDVASVASSRIVKQEGSSGASNANSELVGQSVGNAVAQGMKQAEDATESANQRIREYIVSIQDSINEINRLQDIIDEGGISDKEEDELEQKQALHLANINRQNATKEQRKQINADALENAENVLSLVKSGDYGKNAQQMLNEVQNFTDTMQSVIDRWAQHNRKRLSESKPEQYMAVNDETGFILEGQNDTVGGVPSDVVKKVLFRAKGQANSSVHSHPDEQLAAFSFDDIQAAIGQKVKGIIHQYVVSLNDVSMLDVSEFSDEQLQEIVERFKENAYTSSPLREDDFIVDSEKAYSIVSDNIDQYIDGALSNLKMFLGEDAKNIDISVLKDKIQNSLKDQMVASVEDFTYVLTEQISDELNAKGVHFDESMLDNNVINPEASKIQQSFIEQMLLKSIQQVAPNIDISSVYKRTNIDRYMEGESLIPKKQSNEKIDVDLSDYKSQIQSLKEEIQSLREELQSFKNMDITPEGIEELQSQLQQAEQRADGLSAELSHALEGTVDLSSYESLQSELDQTKEKARQLNDELERAASTHAEDAIEKMGSASGNQSPVSSEVSVLDRKVAELQYLYDKVRTIFDGKDGIINEDMSYSEKFDSSEVQRMIELLSQLSDAELKATMGIEGDEWVAEFRNNLQTEINLIRELQEEQQKVYDGTYPEDMEEPDLDIWRHLENIYDIANNVTRQFESKLTPAVREFMSLLEGQVGDDGMFNVLSSQNIDRYINDILSGTKTAKEAFADLENALGWDTDRFDSLIDGNVPQELRGLYDSLFNEVENRIKSAEQVAEEFNAKLREFQSNETPVSSTPTLPLQEESQAQQETGQAAQTAASQVKSAEEEKQNAIEQTNEKLKEQQQLENDARLEAAEQKPNPQMPRQSAESPLSQDLIDSDQTVSTLMTPTVQDEVIQQVAQAHREAAQAAREHAEETQKANEAEMKQPRVDSSSAQSSAEADEQAAKAARDRAQANEELAESEVRVGQAESANTNASQEASSEQESASLTGVADQANAITVAVDAKTKAFNNEQSTVVNAANAEVGALSKVEGAVEGITNAIKNKNKAVKEGQKKDTTKDSESSTVTDNIKKSLTRKDSTKDKGKQKTDEQIRDERDSSALKEYNDVLQEYINLENQRVRLAKSGNASLSEEQVLRRQSYIEKLDEIQQKWNSTQEHSIRLKDEFDKKVKSRSISEEKINTELMSNYNTWAKKQTHYGERLSTINTLRNEKALRPELFTSALDDLEEKGRQLESLFPLRPTDPKGLEQARILSDEIEQMSKEIRSNPEYKNAKDTAVAALKKRAEQWAANNTAAIKADPEGFDKVRQAIKDIDTLSAQNSASKMLDDFIAKSNEAGNTGLKFADTVKNRFKSLAAYLASFASFYDFIRYGKEAIQIVTELDTAMTELKKVSDESSGTYSQFMQESFDMADRVGTTAESIITSTADWKRLGKSFDDAKKFAEQSTVLMNVSEFQNVNDASDALISATQAYDDVASEDIIDRLNYVGNNFAVGTSDLAQGLQNAAAVLKTQGNDIDEALALLTAGNLVGQDMSKASAGIRTISLRIAGTEEAKNELADYSHSPNIR